jgi:hypothetical protein
MNNRPPDFTGKAGTAQTERLKVNEGDARLSDGVYLRLSWSDQLMLGLS